MAHREIVRSAARWVWYSALVGVVPVVAVVVKGLGYLLRCNI